MLRNIENEIINNTNDISLLEATFTSVANPLQPVVVHQDYNEYKQSEPVELIFALAHAYYRLAMLYMEKQQYLPALYNFSRGIKRDRVKKSAETKALAPTITKMLLLCKKELGFATGLIFPSSLSPTLKDEEKLSIFNKAADLFEQGKLKEARECFDQLIAVCPMVPLYYIYRGNCYNLVDGSEAIERAREDLELAEWLIVHEMAQFSSEQKDPTNQMIKLLRKKIQEKEHWYLRKLILEGNKFFDLYEIKKAEAKYSEAISFAKELDETHYDLLKYPLSVAYLRRAEAKISMGKRAEAQLDQMTSVRLDPFNAPAEALAEKYQKRYRMILLWLGVFKQYNPDLSELDFHINYDLLYALFKTEEDKPHYTISLLNEMESRHVRLEPYCFLLRIKAYLDLNEHKLARENYEKIQPLIKKFSSSLESDPYTKKIVNLSKDLTQRIFPRNTSELKSVPDPQKKLKPVISAEEQIAIEKRKLNDKIKKDMARAKKERDKIAKRLASQGQEKKIETPLIEPPASSSSATTTIESKKSVATRTVAEKRKARNQRKKANLLQRNSQAKKKPVVTTEPSLPLISEASASPSMEAKISLVVPAETTQSETTSTAKPEAEQTEIEKLQAALKAMQEQLAKEQLARQQQQAAYQQLQQQTEEEKNKSFSAFRGGRPLPFELDTDAKQIFQILLDADKKCDGLTLGYGGWARDWLRWVQTGGATRTPKDIEFGTAQSPEQIKALLGDRVVQDEYNKKLFYVKNRSAFLPLTIYHSMKFTKESGKTHAERLHSDAMDKGNSRDAIYFDIDGCPLFPIAQSRYDLENDQMTPFGETTLIKSFRMLRSYYRDKLPNLSFECTARISASVDAWFVMDEKERVAKDLTIGKVSGWLLKLLREPIPFLQPDEKPYQLLMYATPESIVLSKLFPLLAPALHADSIRLNHAITLLKQGAWLHAPDNIFLHFLISAALRFPDVPIARFIEDNIILANVFRHENKKYSAINAVQSVTKMMPIKKSTDLLHAVFMAGELYYHFPADVVASIRFNARDIMQGLSADTKNAWLQQLLCCGRAQHNFTILVELELFRFLSPELRQVINYPVFHSKLTQAMHQLDQQNNPDMEMLNNIFENIKNQFLQSQFRFQQPVLANPVEAKQTLSEEKNLALSG
jgi:hypothetical protein